MVEFAYFFQRHPGMDLIDVYCELVLDALHLAMEFRGGPFTIGMGLTVRSCLTLLNWLQIQL
jgi:hypothetical protein